MKFNNYLIDKPVFKLERFMSKIFTSFLVLCLSLSLPGTIWGDSQPPIIEPLTAADVYQMIKNNGFYCHIIKGNPFHGEGLKNMIAPPGYVFHSRRKVSVTIETGGRIMTESVKTSGPISSGEKIIALHWYGDMKNIKECSYDIAEANIKILNNKDKDNKNIEWRIPTIMEFFSMVDENPGNHLPNEFKFPPEQDLVFWTSTPVKKEGTLLDYDKDKKAYFVVHCIYDKKSDDYKLTFDFQNIEGKNLKDALLLPLYSSTLCTYKPRKISLPKKSPPKSIPTPNRIPGFDDVPDEKRAPASTKKPKPTPTPKPTTRPRPTPQPGKIPGFDDVPNDKKKRPTQSKIGSDNVTIALFPYWMSRMKDGNREKYLKNLNDEIEESLDILKGRLEQNLKVSIKIDKKKSGNSSDTADMDTLYNILADGHHADDWKLKNVKSKIMIPKKINIIITVKTNIDIDINSVTLKPMIINREDIDILSATIVQPLSTDVEKVKEFVTKNIEEIIYNNFKR